MMCAWDEFLNIVPPGIRDKVDRLGRYTLQELRLRQGAPPELVLPESSRWLEEACRKEDIGYCIQSASRYSPWTAESIRRGFLTAPGGHRLGLCGLALYRNGVMTGLRDITSVCIRVARDFPGIAQDAPMTGSALILGAPGWGKTTLLRDLVRQRSRYQTVSVVDERGELFPQGLNTGIRTDILRGCRKTEGLTMVLRTMTPGCIALDEITEPEDCQALIQAANCGAELLATAHGVSVEEFRGKKLYSPLVEKGIFRQILLLRQDKTFTLERITG